MKVAKISFLCEVAGLSLSQRVRSSDIWEELGVVIFFDVFLVLKQRLISDVLGMCELQGHRGFGKLMAR